MSDVSYFYWDSNVFLDYFQGEPSRISDIQAVIDEVVRSNEKYRILTSTLTIAEVAYVRHEAESRTLNDAQEALFDAVWRNTQLAALIEVNEAITRLAREMIRKQLGGGSNAKKLKMSDTIQLASARFVGQRGATVIAIHTYNQDRCAPAHLGHFRRGQSLVQ